MKIAIMGAMIEEIEPLLNLLGEYKEHKFGKNIYYEGRYKDLDLVIAYSKIGKVFSALTATTMIEKFGANKLIFSGVAGGINPKLKIGDLIVANRLCQHDVDITAFGHPYGFIPESKVYIESDKELLRKAKEVAQEIGKPLFDGVIATGDQFIADSKKKEWILKEFKADAIEMEGASVAVVCDSLNIPFLIIRAISDVADMDASFSFDEFLSSSANESAKFIFKLLERLS